MNKLELVGKFPAGIITRTRSIVELECQGFDWWEILKRHMNCDWGDLSKDDKKENDYSVDKHLRIFSSYNTKFGKVWIITEADRSATTILLPSDY